MSLLGFTLHNILHAGGSVAPEPAVSIPQMKISHSFFNSSSLYLHLEVKTFLLEVAC